MATRQGRSKLFKPSKLRIVGQELAGNSTQKYYLVRVNDIPMALPWTDFMIMVIMAIRLKADIEGGWTHWSELADEHHNAYQYLYRLKNNIRDRTRYLSGCGLKAYRELLNWHVYQNRPGTGLYRLLAKKPGLVIDLDQVARAAAGDERIDKYL